MPNIIIRSVFLLIVILFSAHAYDINDKRIYQKDFENKTIYLPLNNYRTLVFNERIKDIQLTNSENITAEFIDSYESPLKILKVLGKNISNESAIVTLESGKTIQINFSIMQNLDTIISIVKSTYPNLIIEQANDTVILKGNVKDYRERDLVIDIFKKAGIKTDEKLVDIIETSTPSKMIRVKLYVVEIDNDDGIDIKNNWVASSKNYMSVSDGDEYYNSPLDSYPAQRVITGYDSLGNPTYGVISSSDYSSVNNQRNKELEDALDSVMTNAVSLTGGLTGVANFLGKYFNVGLTLQYLSTAGVANVLDETTLITLENKEATFHAGGTIRVKTSTTANDTTSESIEEIRYGLQLKIKAKNVMKNNYVDLEITTSNTKIDWTNTVDDIPSFIENEVVTNVLAKNQATIVLGGQLNQENSYDAEKIPILGDIPVLGKLFSSEAFKEGKSELVFFLTPEVVDPSENNQFNTFKKTKKRVLDTSKYKESVSWADSKYDSKEEDKEEDSSSFGNLFKSKDSDLTPEQRHKQQVENILYGEE